jgi:hypothetical protein
MPHSPLFWIPFTLNGFGFGFGFAFVELFVESRLEACSLTKSTASVRFRLDKAVASSLFGRLGLWIVLDRVRSVGIGFGCDWRLWGVVSRCVCFVFALLGWELMVALIDQHFRLLLNLCKLRQAYCFEVCIPLNSHLSLFWPEDLVALEFIIIANESGL